MSIHQPDQDRRRNEPVRILVLLVGVAVIGLFAYLASGAPATDQGSAYAAAGAYQVKVVDEIWTDTDRSRALPIRLYVPDGLDGPAPVVLFSHGLGGSRQAATYLGRHWASHGYVCVFMQHPGSDESLWKGVPLRDRLANMKKAITNPGPALDRIADVRFVIDELIRKGAIDGSPVHGFVDAEHIAMAGHSFGAWTTMAVGGQTFIKLSGELHRPVDERIEVLLPLSPAPPRQRRQHAVAFANMGRPVMMMTGTLDDSPISNQTAADRIKVFDMLTGRGDDGWPVYTLVLNGGDHAVFNGGRRWRRTDGADGDSKLDKQFHRLIRGATTACLAAYLHDNAQAKRWLDDGGLEKFAGDTAQVKVK